MAPAELNLVGFSDFSQADFDDLAQTQLRESLKFDVLVSQKRRVAHRTAWKFSSLSGLNASTTALADNASNLNWVTPSESLVTVSSSFYQQAIRYTERCQATGIVDLYETYLQDFVGLACETFDTLALTAAIAGTTNVKYIGQTSQGAITASNTMTLDSIRVAVATLRASKVPGFIVPGYGELYVAPVHSHVAKDMRAESSGIMFAKQNVNAEDYIAGVLGVCEGVLFIETGNTALVTADAGSGAVDVYSTPIMGRGALGMVYTPIDEAPSAFDVPVFADRSMVVRVTNPASNQALITEVGFLGQLGFGLTRDAAVYRIESAASMGTNT